MKIEVKYNIDFGKALKELEGNKLSKFVNNNLAPKTADLSRRYIRAGLVTPELSENNPRSVTDKRGRTGAPLLDTGELARSLKGSSRGISGVDYAKEHREPGGYKWFKEGVDSKGFGKGGYVEVPQREFIPYFENGEPVLKGSELAITKVYEDFEKKFIILLNKRIRKK